MNAHNSLTAMNHARSFGEDFFRCFTVTRLRAWICRALNFQSHHTVRMNHTRCPNFGLYILKFRLEKSGKPLNLQTPKVHTGELHTTSFIIFLFFISTSFFGSLSSAATRRLFNRRLQYATKEIIMWLCCRLMQSSSLITIRLSLESNQDFKLFPAKLFCSMKTFLQPNFFYFAKFFGASFLAVLTSERKHFLFDEVFSFWKFRNADCLN